MDEAPNRTAAPPFITVGSLARVLVEATSRALRGRDCADLDQVPDPGWSGQASCLNGPAAHAAEEAALPSDRADEIDAGAVARWVVNQYQGRSYAGAIIGSAHGSAAHLAAAMGVPWLPVGFEADIAWPGGCVADAVAAMNHGSAAAARAGACDEEMLVRQVHDPVGVGFLAGCRVNLRLRWSVLPDAYRRFLDTSLTTGAFVLLLRDVRAWSVLDHGDGYAFQIGSAQTALDPREYVTGRDLRDILHRCGHAAVWRAPTGPYRRDCGENGVDPGVEADLRHWAHRSGGSLHTVRYRDPDALSAGVAGIYRRWLRDSGAAGDRLVVESGRLLDPWRVASTATVPYWCENASSAAVAAAELWVAGSEPFATIDIFPCPPGTIWSRLASMEQWAVLAAFASERGTVNDAMTCAYPLRPVAPSHATRALGGRLDRGASSAPLTLDAAIEGVRRGAAWSGLVVASPASI